MNYRHIYHAGNFADLVKHLTLISIIQEMKKKPNPMMVLDCFAGTALYDISSKEAQKTSEYLGGISKFLQLDKKILAQSQILSEYYNILSLFNKKLSRENNISDNNNQNIRFYPGSPFIIAKILDNHDRIISCELHNEEYSKLKENFSLHKRKFHCKFINQQKDAYLAIKSSIPFLEKRGLIYIDPPFEENNEFDKILASFELIQKSFRNSVVAIWYPVKNTDKVANFESQIIEKTKGEIYRISLSIDNSFSKQKIGLKESRIIISNPPNIIQNLSNAFQLIGMNKFTIEILK